MNIRRLTLETANLETMLVFYRHVLELPVFFENYQIHIKIGSSELVFFENANKNAKYHIALNIPESQIEDAKTWLEARVPLVPDGEDLISDFPNWNAHAVYFLDPAGNILELIARHELSHQALQPFTSRALLSISEIGLPVPDALEFADWIGETCQIPKYRQGSSSFTPIGDAEGLLIAVSLGREWHPKTGIISEPFYTRIALKSVGIAPLAIQYLDLPYWFSRV